MTPRQTQPFELALFRTAFPLKIHSCLRLSSKGYRPICPLKRNQHHKTKRLGRWCVDQHRPRGFARGQGQITQGINGAADGVGVAWETLFELLLSQFFKC